MPTTSIRCVDYNIFSSVFVCVYMCEFLHVCMHACLCVCVIFIVYHVCVCVFQRVSSECVCVPVLCGRRGELPEGTAWFLRRLRVCEASLLWRDDINLLQLNQSGKLSLTLLTDGLLDR